MSKIDRFKQKAENILSKLENLVGTMPEKGNTSTDCQRTYLQQQINEVYYAINGVVERDLIETPYCCDNCGGGFTKKEMNFGIEDQDLCKSCS